MVEPLRKPWASAHAPPTVTGLLRRGPASQALRRPRGAPGTETPAEAAGRTDVAGGGARCRVGRGLGASWAFPPLCPLK